LTNNICISILPRNLPEALQLIEKAETINSDLIEVRLDFLDTVADDLAVLVTDRETPLIATDKSNRDAADHRLLMLNAAKSGFKYVDLDLSTPRLKDIISEVRDAGVDSIVSYHNNQDCPILPELHSILNKELSEGADVCKVVFRVKKMQDNLTLLQFTLDACKQARIICFGIGELGKMSRLLTTSFGGFLTFSALERGCETASGQMTFEETRAFYRLMGFK
jgi:3-dehydroquinate dehydratase-1